MIDMIERLGVDGLAGIFGIVVALWAILATAWQLYRSNRRETLALTALAVALAVLAQDQRRRRHDLKKAR